MPHIIVKLFTGRTEEQKHRIADAIAKAVMETAGSAESSISVSLEDVAPEDWTKKVYDPDIGGKPDTLYKKPGYARQ